MSRKVFENALNGSHGQESAREPYIEEEMSTSPRGLTVW